MDKFKEWWSDSLDKLCFFTPLYYSFLCSYCIFWPFWFPNLTRHCPEDYKESYARFFIAPVFCLILLILWPFLILIETCRNGTYKSFAKNFWKILLCYKIRNSDPDKPDNKLDEHA